jgi:glycosyltransferase involved in cell wall biosynthesis
LPNGVDVDFYNPELYSKNDFRIKHGFKIEDTLFFYGGILGHAQGLQTVLKAAKLIESTTTIQIILQGSGPEKEELLKLKESLQLENVHFLPPVSKSEMPFVLKEVDVALVPLRKLDLFQGAIPSKIFEALAMEKPLLLGVNGEAKAHFIDKAKAGFHFEPENEVSLAEKLEEFAQDKSQIIKMGKMGREYVIENFNRNKIAQDFIQQL